MKFRINFTDSVVLFPIPREFVGQLPTRFSRRFIDSRGYAAVLLSCDAVTCQPQEVDFAGKNKFECYRCSGGAFPFSFLEARASCIPGIKIKVSDIVLDLFIRKHDPTINRRTTRIVLRKGAANANTSVP